MDSKAKVLPVVVIALIIVSGFAYDYVHVRSAIDKLRIVDVSIGSINTEGSPIPSKVRMDVLLRVSNPTGYAVMVDKLRYDVYIDGELVAQGIKHNMIMYANSNTTISIPVEVYTLNAVKSVLKSLKTGTANVEVKGFIEIPVRWFGIIRSFTISAPYSISKTIKLNLPSFLPVGTSVKVTNAGFEPPTATVGENVGVVVGLRCDEKLTYNIKVVVKEDIAYGFDKVIYTYTTTVRFPGYKTVKFTWIPPEPSHGRLRGYFIEVYADNRKIYSMPNNYPPRLKVSEQNPAPTQTASEGELHLINVYWLVNGIKSYTAHVGDNVEGCVLITAEEGKVDASIGIQIKKDLTLRPDKTLTEKYFTITLNPGEERTLCISFIPQERSGTWFRGYFIEVHVNGNKFYTMPSHYPPRLKIS